MSFGAKTGPVVSADKRNFLVKLWDKTPDIPRKIATLASDYFGLVLLLLLLVISLVFLWAMNQGGEADDEELLQQRQQTGLAQAQLFTTFISLSFALLGIFVMPQLSLQQLETQMHALLDRFSASYGGRLFVTGK